jgi:hypothetical protein
MQIVSSLYRAKKLAFALQTAFHASLFLPFLHFATKIKGCRVQLSSGALSSCFNPDSPSVPHLMSA